MPLGRPHDRRVLAMEPSPRGRALRSGDTVRIWVRPRVDLARFEALPPPDHREYDAQVLARLRVTDDDVFLEAAELLRDTLHAAFGAERLNVQIAERNNPASLMSPAWDIHLATIDALRAVGASVNLAKLDRDDFGLLLDPTGGRRIFIAGYSINARADGSGYGVFFGVARLLRQWFGARWCFPGTLGSVIPSTTEVPLEGINVLDGPDYRDRTFGYGQARLYPEPTRQAVRQWMMCNGMRPWLHKGTEPLARLRVTLRRLDRDPVTFVLARTPPTIDNELFLPEARYNISHVRSRMIPSEPIAHSMVEPLRTRRLWPNDAALYPSVFEALGDDTQTMDLRLFAAQIPFHPELCTVQQGAELEARLQAVQTVRPRATPEQREATQQYYRAVAPRFTEGRLDTGVWRFRPRAQGELADRFHPCHFAASPTLIPHLSTASPAEVETGIELSARLVEALSDVTRWSMRNDATRESVALGAVDGALPCTCRPCLVFNTRNSLEPPDGYSGIHTMQQIALINAVAAYTFDASYPGDTRTVVFLAYHGDGTLWPPPANWKGEFKLVRQTPVPGALGVRRGVLGVRRGVLGADPLGPDLGEILGWKPPKVPPRVPVPTKDLLLLDARAMPYISTTRDDDAWEPGAVEDAPGDRWLHQRWGELALQTGLYEYESSYQGLIPMCYPLRLAEALRFGWEHNACGYYAENQAHWGVESLHLYVTARLLWQLGERATDADSDERVRELSEEFCEALYGPEAGLAMAIAYRLLEDMWCGRRVVQDGGGSFGPSLLRDAVARVPRGERGPGAHLKYMGNSLGAFDLASTRVMDAALRQVAIAEARVRAATDTPEGSETRSRRLSRIAFMREPLRIMRANVPFFQAWRAVEKVLIELSLLGAILTGRDAFASTMTAEMAQLRRTQLLAVLRVLTPALVPALRFDRVQSQLQADLRTLERVMPDTQADLAFDRSSILHFEDRIPYRNASGARSGEIVLGLDYLFNNVAQLHNRLLRALSLDEDVLALASGNTASWLQPIHELSRSLNADLFPLIVAARERESDRVWRWPE